MATQQQTDTTPRFIRPYDFERQTGMSRWSVYRALKAGTLKGVKIGGQCLIERSELRDYFEREGRRVAA